jgi:hypothetical protein
MEPRDYHDAPIWEVLGFIQSVGLIKGHIRRGSTIKLGLSVQEPDEFLPTPTHIYIHTLNYFKTSYTSPCPRQQTTNSVAGLPLVGFSANFCGWRGVA